MRRPFTSTFADAGSVAVSARPLLGAFGGTGFERARAAASNLTGRGALDSWPCEFECVSMAGRPGPSWFARVQAGGFKSGSPLAAGGALRGGSVFDIELVSAASLGTAGPGLRAGISGETSTVGAMGSLTGAGGAAAIKDACH
jgi:hypothetical protein